MTNHSEAAVPPPVVPTPPEWASVPQADAWQTPPAPAPAPVAKSPKLGRVAMIMAICVIGLSVLISVLQGVLATTLRTYSTNAGAGFNMHPDQGWFGLQLLLGSIFGIWALTRASWPSSRTAAAATASSRSSSRPPPRLSASSCGWRWGSRSGTTCRGERGLPPATTAAA